MSPFRSAGDMSISNLSHINRSATLIVARTRLNGALSVYNRIRIKSILEDRSSPILNRTAVTSLCVAFQSPCNADRPGTMGLATSKRLPHSRHDPSLRHVFIRCALEIKPDGPTLCFDGHAVCDPHPPARRRRAENADEGRGKAAQASKEWAAAAVPACHLDAFGDRPVVHLS